MSSEPPRGSTRRWNKILFPRAISVPYMISSSGLWGWMGLPASSRAARSTIRIFLTLPFVNLLTVTPFCIIILHCFTICSAFLITPYLNFFFPSPQRGDRSWKRSFPPLFPPPHLKPQWIKIFFQSELSFAEVFLYTLVLKIFWLQGHNFLTGWLHLSTSRFWFRK